MGRRDCAGSSGVWFWLIACLAFLGSAGCQTYAQRMDLARQQFYNGDLEQAAAALEQEQQRKFIGDDLLKLEHSMVLLAEGRAAESERLLREVRDRFDELEGKSLAEEGLVWLTDDGSRAYAGEDYEKVLIRAMLALANLMQGGGDAEAYSLQVVDKQGQIIEAASQADGTNPKAAYQQVALGPYLRGVLQERTHLHYDDAARSYEHVIRWQLDFADGPRNLQRAQHGHHSEKGSGVLHVFALVGRGPRKVEVPEIPSSGALLVADRIISALGKQTLPPTVSPIKIPQVQATNNHIQSIGLDVDGRPMACTQTITDINAMAVSQANAIHDLVVGKAVARRAVKKGIIYGAKELTGVEKHSLAGLGFDLAGMAYEAVERADTRCWSLLPAAIQVQRLEVPAGTHLLTVRPLDHGFRPFGQAASQAVTISDGRDTYVLVFFPGEQMIGRVLVGE